jgi:peptidoglycan hydrolase-like protein with peptidoglycan-binding domain
MASNGKIPGNELAPINGFSDPNDRLYKSSGAAAGWNAMCHEAKSKGMAIPEPTGPNSSYRTYESQVFFWNHQPPLAARPGTSNHGWGRAVDNKTQAGVNTIKAIGAKYGWYWGEVKSEWWHTTYYGGYKGKDPGPVDQKPDPLKKGDKGKDVHTLQGRLKRLGFHPLKDEYTKSTFGSQTEQIVKRFQQNNELTADGVVGDQTYAKIKNSLNYKCDRNRLTETEDHYVDLYYRSHSADAEKQIREQMKKIKNAGSQKEHDRAFRYQTLEQIVDKHGKLHVD